MKRSGGQETQYFRIATRTNIQDSLDLNSDMKCDLLLNWQSSIVVEEKREKQRIWVTDQDLSSSPVQLARLVTNSQRNVRDTGHYFCLDKRKRKGLGNHHRVDGVDYSDKMQNIRCGGRMKEDQE